MHNKCIKTSNVWKVSKCHENLFQHDVLFIGSNTHCIPSIASRICASSYILQTSYCCYSMLKLRMSINCFRMVLEMGKDSVMNKYFIVPSISIRFTTESQRLTRSCLDHSNLEYLAVDCKKKV